MTNNESLHEISSHETSAISKEITRCVMVTAHKLSHTTPIWCLVFVKINKALRPSCVTAAGDSQCTAGVDVFNILKDITRELITISHQDYAYNVLIIVH